MTNKRFKARKPPAYQGVSLLNSVFTEYDDTMCFSPLKNSMYKRVNSFKIQTYVNHCTNKACAKLVGVGRKMPWANKTGKKVR